MMERRYETVKRSDALILIAVWEFLTAAPPFIAILAISIFAFPDVIGDSDAGAIFGLSIALLMLVSFFGLAVGAGIGLLLRKEWGRILAIIHSVFSLLFVPFGTIIGVLAIIYLITSQTRGYFEPT